MACGVPVAAYPVTGPKDVIQSGVTGQLNDDLQAAVNAALAMDNRACISYAQQNSWQSCTEAFSSFMYDNQIEKQKSQRAITNQTFWCL